MALFKEEKSQVIKKFARAELDTGSSEVQVALLSYRIQKLTDHFKANKKDNHSRRGLLKVVSRRRNLLDYLKITSPNRYLKIINELGLRR